MCIGLNPRLKVDGSVEHVCKSALSQMARPRVRRKTQQPNSKVSRKPKNPYNISFAGAHPLVKEHWDKSLTLKQNYANIGLVPVLNGMAGGQGSLANEHYASVKAQLLDQSTDLEWRDPSEIPKESVVRILSESDGIEPPLLIDDRVTAIGSKVNLKKLRHVRLDQTQKESKPVIEAMEEEAKHSVTIIRQTSDHEDLVLSSLKNKYGQDFAAMARDIKLNKYQLTAGQLKKRFTRQAMKQAGIRSVLN